MRVSIFVKRLFTWWHDQTIAMQLFTWRNGVHVGTDEQGNIYYRNKDDSRRWVVYNGDIEGSRVSPDWHGWLHKTWNDPPSSKPLKHKEWEKPHQENLTGTLHAYAPQGSLRQSAPVSRQDYQPWQPE